MADVSRFTIHDPVVISDSSHTYHLKYGKVSGMKTLEDGDYYLVRMDNGLFLSIHEDKLSIADQLFAGV